MAMPAGCKYTPGEEVLVGKVLRKRVRGEPLDYAAADCIREADVYADDPARLTAVFPPTNRGTHEWFFFSWCKVKKKISKKDGGGGRGRGMGVKKKRRRKERTVRGAGGVEIGQWRSTQAVKDVIQIDGSGCSFPIGYHQNFEFRDINKQKSDWLMEEYGIHPSSTDGAAAEAADDKELVICKIYKTPAARRAEAKQSTAPTALPPPVLQVLSPPPPWSALPPLLPTSSSPEQQPQPSWHDSMMGVGIPTHFCRPLDRDWPDVPHGAVVFPELYEAVAPFFTCSSVSSGVQQVEDDEDQEEEEEEEDLRAAFLPSVLTERPQALSDDHAHNPDEFFFGMIEDGFPFGEMPTIVDDCLMIDGSFNFLDSGYSVM